MLHRPAFDLLLLAILLLTLSVTVHTDAVNLPLALRIDTPVARPSDLPAAMPLLTAVAVCSCTTHLNKLLAEFPC